MSLPTPYYDRDGITVYCADNRDILPHLGRFDLLLTDPPYPNNAGHFTESVEVAREVVKTDLAPVAMVFWDELETPEARHPLVAKHIWHRSNSNRPDNYEAIYQFSSDGIKRASRVLSYPVIYPGLTGCREATGHPTQKSQKLICRLLRIDKQAKTVLDPFGGSLTTAVACKLAGVQCTIIEMNEDYCRKGVERLKQGVLSFAEATP